MTLWQTAGQYWVNFANGVSRSVVPIDARLSPGDCNFDWSSCTPGWVGRKGASTDHRTRREGAL
jgi:hypothetical protein